MLTERNVAHLALSLILTLSSVTAFAAGSHGSSHGHGHGGKHAGATGQPGEASEVTRTIEVVMHDSYYDPKAISVESGETVRVVVKNAGQLVHEFNVGTAEMHTAHQKEMLEMMNHGVLRATRIDHSKMHGMAHDDPNSVLLEPGESGEIIWKFAASDDLEFACNVPGHYAAGMVGRITNK